MKLFIKIYAEDLHSACSTIPFTIPNALPHELTLGELRKAIENQITQPLVFKRKNQIISVGSEGGKLIAITADDDAILEDINVVQGSIIHLQDRGMVNRAKYNKTEIDWSKMTLNEAGDQIDSASSGQANG